MRGDMGQRAPSSWTPGFTSLPGTLPTASRQPSPERPRFLSSRRLGSLRRDLAWPKTIWGKQKAKTKEKKMKNTKPRSLLETCNHDSSLSADCSSPLRQEPSKLGCTELRSP